MSIRSHLRLYATFASALWLGNLFAHSVPYFEQSRFTAHASLYGNKTANLMELEHIAEYLNTVLGKKQFAVPPFLGISGQEIVQYVENLIVAGHAYTVGYQVNRYWERFCTAQAGTVQALTTHACTALATIRDTISNNLFDIQSIIASTRAYEVKPFYAAASANNQLIMVRSTGREDSKELSNAGGNASVANVHLDNPQEVSNALSTVICSYFSEKSIGQRLMGGDKHLFDAPCMPVLLQVMIGEQSDACADIPVSGVMFTREAEGNTPGVTVIQATYGHNEGVVNGLVPVDTYYIGASGVIHPIIRIKERRLAPVEGASGLDFVANPTDMRKKSSLDAHMVRMLKCAADTIEQYYGEPMDVEFVVQNGIIYFVQARPIENKKLNPSFVEDAHMATLAADKIVPITPIGVGDAHARIISDIRDVIIADTLGQALDIFLFKTTDKERIKAIIVREMAPATSHEATQFRRMGKPVLYTHNTAFIRSWLTSDGDKRAVKKEIGARIKSWFMKSKSLVIDMQRAVIICYDAGQQGIIQNGWYRHPIGSYLSLIPEFIPQCTEEQFAQLNPCNSITHRATADLMAAIKQGNVDALRTLVYRVIKLINKAEQKEQDYAAAARDTQPLLGTQLKHILSLFLSTAHEAYMVITREHDPLELLYPLTFLQALLSQLPKDDACVHTLSIGYLLAVQKREQEIIDAYALQGAQSRAHLVQYAKAGSCGLTNVINWCWGHYVHSMKSIADDELQQQFAQLVYALTDLQIFPLWINTTFYRLFMENLPTAFGPLPTAPITQAMINDYTAAKDHITLLQSYHRYFKNVPMGAWEDPKVFEKQWHDFMQHIAFFQSAAYKEIIERGTQVAQIVAVQVMQQVISTFDASIKSLLASQIYTNDVKVRRFKQMLLGYYELLHGSATIDSMRADLEQMLDRNTFTSLEQYFTHIKFGLDATTDNVDELNPTSEFNVAAAVLGSKALWGRSVGERGTLEDFFTLIHQNLLVVQAVMARKAGLNAMATPAVVDILKQAIGSLQTYTANMIGVTCTDNELIYAYNVPLSNHSSTLHITYHMVTQKTTLTVTFLGQARTRWDRIKNDVEARMQEMTLSKPITLDTTNGLLTFVWEIPSANVARRALQLFAEYVQWTF